MNELEQIGVLQSALDQLLTESSHLLVQFKQQVAYEQDYGDRTKSETERHHVEVYNTIYAEWTLIKSLYFLLASNTLAISYQNPDENIKPFEYLLTKLAPVESLFKNVEFQFPFNLSNLLTGIKATVKKFIKTLQPTIEPAYRTAHIEQSTVINTNNVKTAAKKFQDIQDKVAESAKTLKRPTPAKSVTILAPVVTISPELIIKKKTVGISSDSTKVEAVKFQSAKSAKLNFKVVEENKVVDDILKVEKIVAVKAIEIKVEAVKIEELGVVDLEAANKNIKMAPIVHVARVEPTIVPTIKVLKCDSTPQSFPQPLKGSKESIRGGSKESLNGRLERGNTTRSRTPVSISDKGNPFRGLSASMSLDKISDIALLQDRVDKDLSFSSINRQEIAEKELKRRSSSSIRTIIKVVETFEPITTPTVVEKELPIPKELEEELVAKARDLQPLDTGLDTINVESGIDSAVAFDSPTKESSAPVINRAAKPKVGEIRKLTPLVDRMISADKLVNDPKRARPKTKLEELKSMTDQVAKRRQEISSVMLTDRDYIIGIMTAFESSTDEFGKMTYKGVSSDDLLSAPKEEASDASKYSDFNVVREVEEPKEIDIRKQVTTKVSNQVDVAQFESTGSLEAEESRLEDKTSILPIHLHRWAKPKTFTQLLLVPLNAMFDLKSLELTKTHRFGRNNSTEHPAFQGFGSLVISRNHLDIFLKDNRVFIKDIGSNSGTFKNNMRLCPAAEVSDSVEIFTGDYIQLGKDSQNDLPLDDNGRVQGRRRCVRFQVVVINPGQTGYEAIKTQSIPIERPVPRSESSYRANPVELDREDYFEQAADEVPVKANLPSALSNKNFKQIFNGSGSVLNLPGNSLESLNPAVGAEIQTHNHIKEISKAPREAFVLAYTIVGSKVTKMLVSTIDGPILDINMKKWDDKNRVTILDSRGGSYQSFEMYNDYKKKTKSIHDTSSWQVVSLDGVLIGKITFISAIKIEIYQVEKTEDGSTVAITGDFKEQRYICVKKWPNSREQYRFGECKGRHLAKKGLRENQWLANFDLQDSKLNRLVLSASILSCLLSVS